MKKYIYGVDLGGTTIKIGFFPIDGELIEKFEIKTNTENGGINILGDIVKAINSHMLANKLSKDDVKGLGIGVPGPVSNGIVQSCVNLGWGSVEVKSDLERLINLPVSVSNDANVAGFGELWKGGGTGYNNLVFITLGTGVGGAVVCDNKIVDGHVGCGGEIGHAPSLDNEFKCNCGKIGCLETVASATGIVRIANKFLKTSSNKSILRGKENISSKDVFDAAKKNDDIALKTIDYFGKNLGFVCATLAVTTNPEAIVFGGGVSKAGDILIDVVKKHFNEYAFSVLRETTKFKLATLGNDAGIYGAAYLANQM